MSIARLLIFAVITALSISQSTAQERPDERVQCTITVPNTDWKSSESSIIHVKLVNRTSKNVDLAFHATLYLTPISRSEPLLNSVWAPVNLRKDESGPILKEGGTITRIVQRLRLGVEQRNFSLHAFNMQWQKRISSTWPDRELSEVASAGEYEVQLVLETDEGVAASNIVRVRVGEH